MRRLALLLLLAPLAVAHSQSGEPSGRADDPAFEVVAEEAVVTAGRLPAEAERTGRNVSVITAADIARSPARSLDELLRFEAGVLTTPRGGLGAQADISMRGGTFNGVVLLVDGARFNDPMSGHFLSDFPIPLSEIARVEVVRGPEAAAWGPDALGGVVHVITHTGAADAAFDAERREIHASVGQHETLRGTTGTLVPAGGILWSGAVDLVRTDGEPVLDEAGRPIVGSAGEVRTDFERSAVTGSFLAPVRRLGARVYVRTAAEGRSFGAYQFYTPFASDTAREETSTVWAQARLASARQEAETSWSVSLSGRVHHDLYAYYPGVLPNDHTSRQLGVTVDVSRRLSPALTLGVGASAEGRNITSNSLGEHGDVSGSVFALARWAPVAPLTVSASARLDADPGFGVEPTPMLALAYGLAPGVVLRAAAGRAVRSPNYVERYYNTVAPRPGGNLGNPELRAERAWNGEAGLDLAPLAGVALQATAFYRQTDDLIDYVRTAVGGEAVFLAQNVLAAEAAGLEASASAAVPLAAQSTLRLTGGYTYTDVRVDTGGFAEGDFKYVLDHAPHLWQLRAAAEAGSAVLAVEGLHKTRLALDGVSVVHAQLAVAVPGTSGALRLSGEVRNVFDARYTEVFGAPMPGRWASVGLRLITP